ncbi:hypothetical protein H0H93_003877, partial [Arthromyces matolae]
ISTREEDFIIDTLALRDELAELNEAFTNPNIVKVMIFHAVFDTFIDCKAQVLHGAESDIVWLQQNFDLYIVNLFDTFHASKALGDYYFFAIEFPRHGLANLLEMYCDFSADKRYQLADWRIR